MLISICLGLIRTSEYDKSVRLVRDYFITDLAKRDEHGIAIGE